VYLNCAALAADGPLWLTGFAVSIAMISSKFFIPDGMNMGPQVSMRVL